MKLPILRFPILKFNLKSLCTITLISVLVGLMLEVSFLDLSAESKPKRSYKPVRLTSSKIFRGERRGGGTYSGSETCTALKDKDKDYLIAVVPEFKDRMVGGVTSQEYPYLWFYLNADNKKSGCKLSLELLQENGESIQKKSIKIPDEVIKGLIPTLLPEKLELNKTYRWKLTLAEKQSGEDKDIGYVQGYIRRESASNSDYLWYDDLNDILRVYQDNPQSSDAKRTWQDFLKETWPDFIPNEDISRQNLKQQESIFLGEQPLYNNSSKANP